jgi:hypothetical protein
MRPIALQDEFSHVIEFLTNRLQDNFTRVAYKRLSNRLHLQNDVHARYFSKKFPNLVFCHNTCLPKGRICILNFYITRPGALPRSRAMGAGQPRKERERFRDSSASVV